MHFRYALHELQLGKHPDSPTWAVSRIQSKLKHGVHPKDLGPLPHLGSWPLAQQRKLINVIRGVNIKQVSSTSPFPDWLGYLGLGLLYTEDAEREGHVLSQAWALQLMTLLPKHSSSFEMLESIISDSTRILSWRDLEAVEADLRNARLW